MWAAHAGKRLDTRIFLHDALSCVNAIRSELDDVAWQAVVSMLQVRFRAQRDKAAVYES